MELLIYCNESSLNQFNFWLIMMKLVNNQKLFFSKIYFLL